jgi:hypothetical protein
MLMNPLDAFQATLAEIGDAPAAELAAHLQKKHGVTIEPKFIPLSKATLQDREKNARIRQTAKSAPPETSSTSA